MEIKRRDFLKILGVSGVAAAVTGCSSETPRTLIPYLIPEDQIVPGQATWYATVCRECPAGCGMLAKTMEGRVVKVEGNPDHPVNQGRLCARGQASLQGLYNPDRIRQPLRKGADGTLQPVSWDEVGRILAGRISELKGQGDRLAFITPVMAGSLDRLVDLWLESVGSSKRLRYEPLSYESLKEANRITFGVREIPVYDLQNANFILSFGADFLETWLSPVEYARHFASTRAYRAGVMGRSVYVGPRLSLTGANSDEWIAVHPGNESFLALGMVNAILAEGLAEGLPAPELKGLQNIAAAHTPEAVAKEVGISADKIRVLARVFAKKHPSLALADAKSSNATDICVAVNLLNYVAGNVGATVRFGAQAAMAQVSSYGSFPKLLREIEQGEISILFLAGVNPLFDLPEGKRWREGLGKIPLVVSFSSFPDETAQAAHLVLPDNTFLESWGDYEPWTGMRGLQQPVMEPFYDTRPLGDILLLLSKRLETKEKLPWENFYLYLRDQWKELYQRIKPDVDFETFWAESVRRGGNFQSAPTRSIRLNPEVFQKSFKSPAFAGAGEGFALIPYPSLAFYDGRMANRPWLQELPDPVSQIVWENWLEIHPRDAKQLGIRKNDLLEIQSPAGQIKLAAHISKGVKPGTVAIPVGQGHAAFGRYAQGRGASPISLLSPEAEAESGALIWYGTRVTLRRTGLKQFLASTVGSDRSYDRGISQTISLAALQGGIEKETHPHLLQMYPEHRHEKHRWGMVIDLNACIGCSACVVACSAENNIPIMGKAEVAYGREMSWIRIQRYDEGTDERPDHHFIPMLCQQCDYAPCEPVCPVYATYHNSQGLNAQVYNRCVGTRYCSNNCPYKVRRFNWYTAQWPEPLNLQLNPDVTVREMGVMEKCTFCVQRIRAAELSAKREKRELEDGEIVPACSQTCPTRAIVFGDLNDPKSEVAKLSKDPRGYHVLEDLNTRPAITYLKKIRVGLVEG
ncbi:MAG: molybdopterin-dependent oxidoreductase [Deltaproteobacteria bacterium]|nr:molybdopterin-dependent oxidoreductase [Deltaproteobacteria bacterium]